MTPSDERHARQAALRQTAADRILVFDGAMGTMIQRYDLDEAGFRGTRFADASRDQKGNNDLLILSQPDILRDVHRAYLEAGADLIATNTFNSTTISQADYGMEEVVDELNREGARLAREAADAMTERTPERPRFVAGAMGPTNRTASMSPDVDDPGFRNISFDELRDVYKRASRALIEGGADVLLLETIFDTLNAKAAIFGILELFDEIGFEVPLIVSGTITDKSGRNLSGQTVEAFWHSVRHSKPFAIGLNCAFGAAELRPFVAALAKAADTLVCAYPNAGLPNEMGGFDETPEVTAGHLGEWAQSGFVNIVGGCCGTTPEHIRAISDAVSAHPTRPILPAAAMLRLSGLEPFTVSA